MKEEKIENLVLVLVALLGLFGLIAYYCYGRELSPLEANIKNGVYSDELADWHDEVSNGTP